VLFADVQWHHTYQFQRGYNHNLERSSGVDVAGFSIDAPYEMLLGRYERGVALLKELVTIDLCRLERQRGLAGS
jgi:hypothetical protein